MPPRATWLAVVGLIAFVAGTWLGWTLGRPQTAPRETPLVAVRQADSSLMLARVPDPAAKPRQIIPKGAVVERVATIAVQPEPVRTPANSTPSPDPSRNETDVPRGTIPSASRDSACTCAPVFVDLSLVRLQDGTRRVIASARSGRILDSLSIDSPVAEPVPVSRNLRWSAGVDRDAATGRYGGFLDRDLGPWHVGLTALPQSGGAAVGIRAGLRF